MILKKKTHADFMSVYSGQGLWGGSFSVGEVDTLMSSDLPVQSVIYEPVCGLMPQMGASVGKDVFSNGQCKIEFACLRDMCHPDIIVAWTGFVFLVNMDMHVCGLMQIHPEGGDTSTITPDRDHAGHVYIDYQAQWNIISCVYGKAAG